MSGFLFEPATHTSQQGVRQEEGTQLMAKTSWPNFYWPLCLVFPLFLTLSACGKEAGKHSPDASNNQKSDDEEFDFLIRGFVYERERSPSYSLDLDEVGSRLVCDSISIQGEIQACADDGSYTISVTARNYTPLKAEHADYIPVHQAVWGEKEQVIPVGIYKAPEVTERPGFMKGVAFLDLGNTYPHSVWADIIASPKDRLHAELVSYVEVGFNHACDGADHNIAVASAHPSFSDWRFSTEDELRPMVTEAHEAGVAFNLWLGTISVNECDGGAIYDIDRKDSSLWDLWFDGYRKILLERTQVAKDLGIEWITLGHNMEYVSRLSAERWKRLVDDVRSLYPGVKLAYFGAAVMSENPPYLESEHYNEGSPKEFVSLLDAIGHAVTSVANEPNPSRSEIIASFATIFKKSGELPVPIWIMPMTASTTVGATDPTFIEPELLTDRIGLKYTTNFYQQADVDQALFEAVNGSPTGNGHVMGILPWGYHLRDNFRDTGAESNSHPNTDNLIVDRTANVRGKPAESVVDLWFRRL